MLGLTYLVIIIEEAHNHGTQIMVIPKDLILPETVEDSIMEDILQEDLLFMDILSIILVTTINLWDKIKIFKIMKYIHKFMILLINGLNHKLYCVKLLKKLLSKWKLLRKLIRPINLSDKKWLFRKKNWIKRN